MPPRSPLGFREETQNYTGLGFFDDYVFISLKFIAWHICVFLSSLFQICLSHAQIGLL